MKQVGDQEVSAKTIERVVHDVGPELAGRAMLTRRRTRPWQCVPPAPPNWPSSNAMGTYPHPRAGAWPGRAFHYRRLAGDQERGPDPCVAHRLHRRSSARAAGVLLRLGARGQNRRNRGGSVASSLPGASPNERQEDCPELAKPAKADDWAQTGWSAPCSPASPSQRFSASRWSMRPSEGDSSRLWLRRSWGMGCPGTGRFGRSTSLTSRRSWISSTC